MNVDLWARGIAIYGAALATFTQASKLWKDRAKVRVGAYVETMSDACASRLFALIVRATNVGGKVVTVKGVFVHKGKEKRFVTASTKPGKPPDMLDPTQEVDPRYSPELVTEKTTKLGVFDTEGKGCALPRKHLRELKRNIAPYRQGHK
jgi:hypothetical protein